MISEGTVTKIKKTLCYLTLSELIEAKVSEKMEIQYICSRCGTQNEVRTRLSQTCTDMLTFSLFSNHDLWQRKSIIQTRTKIGAINRFTKKKRVIQSGSTTHAAYTARLRCCCERCGHREPWAKLNHRFIPAVAIIGFALVLFCILFLVLPKHIVEWSSIPFLLLGYAGCILVAAAAEGLLYMIRNAQIKKLQPECRPRFLFPESSDDLTNITGRGEDRKTVDGFHVPK